MKEPALSLVPVTMPGGVGSLGFDTLLGRARNGWSPCYVRRFRRRSRASKWRVSRLRPERLRGGKVRLESHPDADRTGLGELEDIRHMYAHNYAGNADNKFCVKKRHVLRPGVPTKLRCGAQFNGSELRLGLPDLRFYCHLTKREATGLSQRSNSGSQHIARPPGDRAERPLTKSQCASLRESFTPRHAASCLTER
jgi:hypothetical protein